VCDATTCPIHFSRRRLYDTVPPTHGHLLWSLSISSQEDALLLSDTGCRMKRKQTDAKSDEQAVAKAGKEQSPSLDLSQIFPPQTVRSQLYRGEPKLPRIPIQNAALIGTTSACFLKELLDQCRTSRQSSQPTADNLLAAATIQEVVQSNSDFSFLRDTDIQESVTKERRIEYKPKQRKRAATNRVATQAMKDLKQPVEEVAEKSSATDQIILDEEDYD